MAGDSIVVETDEEIPAVIERIRQAASEEVRLVLPARSRFAQSRFNFQLLKQYTTRLGKRVAIVSPDPAVQRMAEESGFTAYRGAGPQGQPAPVQPAPVQPAPQVALPPLAVPGVRVPPPPPFPGVAAPPFAAGQPGAAVGAAGAAGSSDSRLGSIGRIAQRPRPALPAQPAPRIRVGGPGRLPGTLATQAASVRLVLYAGAALVLLAGILAMLFYVPSAQVTLVAEAKPFASELEFSAEPNKAPVRVRTVTAARSASLNNVRATGVKPIGGQVASGEFTYVNACPDRLLVPNGQRLGSQSGVLFAQIGDVEIQSGSAATVTIRAVQPGVAGNLPAGQITVIENNTFKCLAGGNVVPTAGGVDEQKKTVIQSTDLQAAQTQLEQQLRQQLGDDLSRQSQKGERLAPPYFLPSDFHTDHNVDDEVTSFSMTMSLRAEGDFYEAADVDRAFTSALLQKVPVDQQLTTNRVTTDYQVAASGNGHLDFKGAVHGYVAPKIDLAGAKNRLVGRSASQARRDLSKLPVQDVQIRQFPFPLPMLPLTGSRIDLHYEVAEGTAAPKSG